MHTHILAEIDDGSPDVNLSKEFVEILKGQGVTHIALTPHFYSFKKCLHDFISDRENAYNELSALNIQNVSFTLGSEVYLTESLFKYKDLSALCYGNTYNMLTELPYDRGFDKSTYEMINMLIRQYKIIPVLAHIERYPSLFKNIDYIKDLCNKGVKMQINTTSLLQFGTSSKIIKLIKNNFVHALGTDTHSFAKGLDYEKGANVIIKKAGSEYLDEICEASLKILGCI